MQIHWLHAVSGAFSAAADWSGGRVPGASDDAILDAAGSDYSVNELGAATVSSIQTSATGTLGVNGQLTATNGTGGGANAGAINVFGGGTLTLQGGVVNNGSIELYGTTMATATLILASGGVELSGQGAVFLNFTGSQQQQVVPAAGGSILTLNQRISGQGVVGGANLTIDSLAQGFLEAKGGLLTINTGAHTIQNAGLIDAEGAPGYPYTPGQGVVDSPVENNGLVETNGTGSTMTFNGAVAGAGRAIIYDGVMRFNSSFSQEVDFESASGQLVLTQSASYGGMIQGFSKTGGESLDLRDIGFIGAGEASFSGTTSRGVLTVTDGTHVAHITFEDDYTDVAFTAASDGQGGTLITAGLKAFHWLKPVSGSFATLSAWTNSTIPGPTADALLDAAGANFIVTAATTETVAGVRTSTNATLSVTAAFTARGATDNGANLGRIAIGSGGTFTLGGTMNNAGLISLSGPNAAARMIVSGTVTLAGGGEIYLSDYASNTVTGASASAILDNVRNTIAGGGALGGGQLTLINEAAGKIESEDRTTPLLIDTGSKTVVNAGLIEAAGAGLTISSPVTNSGELKSDGGVMTINGAVTGTGAGVVDGGVLRFNAAFNQRVGFAGSSGELVLTNSAAYTAVIQGFSKTGADQIDLRDIGFVGSGEATYSGSTSKGVLTVTNGAHTAHINFEGDYTGVNFTAASDGQGGTIISDGAKAGAKVSASLAIFTAAAASLGQPSAGASPQHPVSRLALASLAIPGAR